MEVLFYDRNLGYEERPGDIVAVDIYDPVHETSFNVEVNEDTDLNQVINNLNQQYLQTGHVNVNYLGPNTVDNNNNVVPQAPNNNQNNNNVVPPAPNNNQNVQNNANDDIFWSLVTICVAGTVVIISTIIKWGWR